MASIYDDGTYLENNPAWHEQDAAWKVTQIVKMMRRHDLVPQRVCDIGCGTGEILRLLAQAGPATAMHAGYDVSPQAYELAKAKETKNLRFFLGKMPDEGEMPFDLITCIDVFEHVEDYFGFLRNLKGKAAHTLFHIPLDLSVQTVLRKSELVKRREGIGHLHYFTKDTALATLNDSGYRVLDHFYTHKFCDSSQAGIANNVVKFAQKALFAIHEDFMVRVIGCSSLMVLANQ